jgi:hypothetical protein
MIYLRLFTWKVIEETYKTLGLYFHHLCTCMFHTYNTPHVLDFHPFSHPPTQFTSCCKYESKKHIVWQFTHTTLNKLRHMQQTNHLIPTRLLLDNNIWIIFQRLKEAMKLTTFWKITSWKFAPWSHIFSTIAKHMVSLPTIMASSCRDQAMYDQ